MGSDGHNNEAGEQSQQQVGQRTRHGDADVPLPGNEFGIGCGLAVVQLRDSADGQQDDGLYPNTRAPGHQGMTELMGQDASEDDSDQGQASPLVGGAMGGVLGVPDEQRHQEKGPVDTKLQRQIRGLPKWTNFS